MPSVRFPSETGLAGGRLGCSPLRTAGAEGSRRAVELSLCCEGRTITGSAATHLASPQIRVTVPSSRSSTVTATSSELA